MTRREWLAACEARPLFYVLEEGEPVAVVDPLCWSRWHQESAERLLARDEPAPGLVVSTVFTGVDAEFEPERRPVLWETLVTARGDSVRTRYASREAALAGHWILCGVFAREEREGENHENQDENSGG